MSVLVISIIMVAMAPVITKRVSDNISVSDVRYEGRLFTASTTSLDGCTQDVDSNQNVCTFTVPENVHSVGVVAVAGGGAGGMSGQPAGDKDKLPNSDADGCIYGTDYTDFDYHQFKVRITPQMSSVGFELVSAAGIGGGGAFINQGAAPTKENCETYNAYFFDPDGDGFGTCITKKNVGDIAGLGKAELTAAGVDVLTAGTDVCASAGNCCWQGTTSGSCHSSGSWGTNSSTYSGCTRTVCNPPAAQKACENYVPLSDTLGETKGKWRLPRYDELLLWQAAILTDSSTDPVFSKFLGENGLDLCSSYSSGSYSTYGALRCYYKSKGCMTNTSGDCSPNYLIGAKYTSTQYSYAYFSSQNFYIYATATEKSPYSARCVFDNYGSDKYIIYGGAGGDGSATLDGIIPEDIIYEYIGENIKLNLPANIKRDGINLTGKNSQDNGLKFESQAVSGGSNIITYISEWFTSNERFNRDFAYIAVGAEDTAIPFYAALPRGISGDPATYSNEKMNPGVVDTDMDLRKCYLNINYQGETSDADSCTTDYYSTYSAPKIGIDGESYYLTLFTTTDTYYDFNDDGTSKTEKGAGGKGTNGPVRAQTSKGGGYRLEKDEATGNIKPIIIVEPETGRRKHAVCLDWRNSYYSSGGFGGGGGGAFRINDVKVNPQDTITIKIGKGGANTYSWNTEKSDNGAASGFEHTSNGVTQSLYVSGGEGGFHGVSSKTSGNDQVRYDTVEAANSVANLRDAAKGGSTYTGTLAGRAERFDGVDGGKTNAVVTVKNGFDIFSSAGGDGGSSGVGSYSGCGGLSGNANCESSNISWWQSSLEEFGDWTTDYSTEYVNLYKSLVGKTTAFKANESNIMNKNYGQAGSGGGGGAFAIAGGLGAAEGGDGTDGYVYVYWAKVD